MIKLNVFFVLILTSFLFYSCEYRYGSGQGDGIRPDIQLMPELKPELNQRLGWKMIAGPWFQRDGTRFSGTQTYYYQYGQEDASPYLVRTFEDGLIMRDRAYRRDGEQFGHTSYDYRGDTLVRVREYFPNDELKIDTYHPSLMDDGLGLIEERHENGSLKFRMRFDEDNRYVGPMTLWDEEGEIVKQDTI